MAVEVILTIASFELMIVGSGTFSTCTVLRPDQTLARIVVPPRSAIARAVGLSGRLNGLVTCIRAVRRAVGARDDAGLDQLLEAAQVVGGALPRSVARHVLDDRALLIDLEMQLDSPRAG